MSHFGRSSQFDSSINALIQSKIRSSKIFVISKIKCPACVEAKALLKKLASKTGVIPVVFELDRYPAKQKRMIVEHLKTGVKTVPQIFVNGIFIGGNDDIQRLHQRNGLVSLIRGRTMKGRVSNNWKTVDSNEKK